MHPLHRALITALVVFCATVAVSAPARADPQPPQQWENSSSKFCMGVAAGNVTDGTAIIQWDCKGNMDQGWELDPVVTVDGVTWYRFRNATNPNKCLSVANKGTSPGAELVIWHCKDATDDADQLWAPFWGVGTPIPQAEIYNLNSGLVIVPRSVSRGAQLALQLEALNYQVDVWAPCPFTAGVNQGCPGV